MPLVNSNVILADARARGYGIPSLLAGNLEMILGQVRAAEVENAPLILAFNCGATPGIPLGVGMAAAADVAGRASVPVATILDHGASFTEVVEAIDNGTSSVMFDGSHLDYEENIRQTRDIVEFAHERGVDVEAELGAIGGSSIYLSESGPQGGMTDPALTADFVQRTGIDCLAISFGNAHGVYRRQPSLDLDIVRCVRELVSIPLVMHGASGLALEFYQDVIDAGISKICYYTAMGRQASLTIRDLIAQTDAENLIYHNIVGWSIDYFYQATRDLLRLLGTADKAHSLQ